MSFPSLPAWRIVLPALAALLPVSCVIDPSGPDIVAGRYSYTAMNSGDTVVVTGTISLHNMDSSALTGTWDLREIRNGGAIGPQTGVGTLLGSTAGGITIDLNPNVADNTVILTGSFNDGEIEGTWQWITLAGVAGQGRFEMKKR